MINWLLGICRIGCDFYQFLLFDVQIEMQGMLVEESHI